MPERIGEGIEKGLCAVVDGLIGARHQLGDRADNENLAGAARAHVAADLLDQIQRAGDVGIDHVAHIGEILVEKSLAETAPGIGEQRLDGPVHAVRG